MRLSTSHSYYEKPITKDVFWFDHTTTRLNTTQLHIYLSQVIAQAQSLQTGVAVIFLALDQFVLINANLDDQTADKLLQMVRQRLQDGLAALDIVVRVGSGEFVAIVSTYKKDKDNEGIAVAKRLLAEIAKPFHVTGRRLFMRSCAGISQFPYDGDDAETLLSHAYAALNHLQAMRQNDLQCYSATASSYDVTEF